MDRSPVRDPAIKGAARRSEPRHGLPFVGPPVDRNDVHQSNHVVDQGGTLSFIDRGTDAKVDRARTRVSSAASPRTSHLSRLIAGNSRRNIVFLALLFALGAAAVAVAAPGGTTVGDTPANPNTPGLAQVGPVAKNGFPAWYKDKNGTRLEPCLDASDPLCFMGALAQPDQPVTPDDVTGNFPDEFFYQAASAGIANVGTADARGRAGKASLDASLEGAFATGPPKAGDQMAFARLRLRVTSGLQGSTNYLFVHPYGERTIQTDPNTDSLFVTEDIGLTPGKFDDAVHGRIAPFLQWTKDPSLPDGYTGDPNVDHTIQGGVNDYFAIIGPGVGANKLADGTQDCPAGVLDKAGSAIKGSKADGTLDPAKDCIYTNLFSLMGKKAQNAGVDVKTATYSRSADGTTTTVDVTADSDKGQSIVVRDATGTPELASTKMLEQDDDNGNGAYYAHIAADSTFADGDRQIEVVNGTDKDPQAHVPMSVKDEILEPSATYNTTDGTLTVTATSSDAAKDASGNLKAQLSFDAPADAPAGTPTVKAQAMPNGTGSATIAFPPRNVKITSSKGGTLVVPVHLDAAGTATAVSLKADAGDDVTAKGSTVTLLGTRSTGKIASYSWTGPYPVITDPACDPAAATCAQVVDTSGGPAPEVGTDVTANVTVPTTGTQWGYQLQVKDAGTGSDTDTVILSAGPGAGPAPTTDPLTPGKVRYTANQGRMVIDGTATVRTSNVIHIWIGKRVPSDLKGWDATATVDPVDGTWAFDTGRDGMPNPPATDCVSYISTHGDPTKVGDNATLAPADEWQCLPIDGRNLAKPLDPAPPAPVVTAAATAPRAIAGAVPLAGAPAPTAAAAPRLAARVAAPAAVTAAALATTGVPVNVTVPKGATLLRARVLTTANKALATTFKKVKGGKKVKVTIRSAKAARQLRGAKRFVVEVRVGTAKNRLGKATRTVIRIRR
jgi:hypothetical protein